MSTAVALPPFEAWYSVRVTRRGAPCFGTTRLPVAAVGGRMLGGDTIDAIRTDYPYLSADDGVRCRVRAPASAVRFLVDE
ncbi:MAG: DUF433 domain-containing protein [Myxococcales bacterium]